MVWKYAWQAMEDVKSYSDSNWAGCKRTARSTSCGIIMRGSHHIKSWSVTQKRVTLSSAEAELAALVKAAAETIGVIQNGTRTGRRSHRRSSRRQFSSAVRYPKKRERKMRHVKIGQLWVQEAAEEEELKFKKIAGEINPADLGTKHLTRKRIDDLTERISLREAAGRADQSLRI